MANWIRRRIHMLNKLLKAISLEEDENEERNWKDFIHVLGITIIVFAVILTVAYCHMKQRLKYRSDDSKVVSEDGTRIVYGDQGAYLMRDGKVLSDVYSAIEKDPYSDYCRVIDENGVIGFISKESGKEIIKPQYIEASDMYNGSSCVNSEKGFYYIAVDGSYMAGDYEEAYPWEMQGAMARVKKADGWAVIDRKGTVLIEKCDSINSLPVISNMGTAIRNGHALLLKYFNGGDGTNSVETIKEFEQFSEISDIFYEQFAIVKGNEGYGAVDVKGKIIVQPIYENLDWDSYDASKEEFVKEIVFKGQKQNGCYDVIDWNPLESD